MDREQLTKDELEFFKKSIDENPEATYMGSEGKKMKIPTAMWKIITEDLTKVFHYIKEEFDKCELDKPYECPYVPGYLVIYTEVKVKIVVSVNAVQLETGLVDEKGFTFSFELDRHAKNTVFYVYYLERVVGPFKPKEYEKLDMKKVKKWIEENKEMLPINKGIVENPNYDMNEVFILRQTKDIRGKYEIM